MSSLLKPIELSLNAALRQDPDTKQQLHAFEGRCIAIEFTDLGYTVSARFIDTDISLSSQDDNQADLTINGKTLALVKLGQAPENLFSKDIAIHGDVQFAKQLQDVLEQFEFDWEALLAKFSGDTLAYPIAQGIRRFSNWAKQNHQSLQMTIAEYLREEARLLPDKAELTPYLNDIDKLRADIDRLEAKIKRLEETK
jgi:ubiquinone biosynthesis protein UbiJ